MDGQKYIQDSVNGKQSYIRILDAAYTGYTCVCEYRCFRTHSPIIVSVDNLFNYLNVISHSIFNFKVIIL